VTPLEAQLEELKTIAPGATLTPLPSGAHLVTVPNVELPPGWDRAEVTVLFLAPPAYPAAQPDCFWASPTGLRLSGGRTPLGSNDANPIPEVPSQAGTWFSWHLQHWNPNRDSLVTYLNVIMRRFDSFQ
jgi:hypothetical protein